MSAADLTGCLANTATVRTCGGTSVARDRASRASTWRGLDVRTNPTASAPLSTAAATSRLVRSPQTLTNIMRRSSVAVSSGTNDARPRSPAGGGAEASKSSLLTCGVVDRRLVCSTLAASSAIAIGTSVVALGTLVRYPLLGGQAIRYAGGAMALAFGMLLLRRPFPRPTGKEAVRLAVLAAAGMVGFNLAVVSALRSAEPAAVGVVVGCVPLVLAVAAPLRVRRLPSPSLISAALIVVGGAAVVQGLGKSDAAGLIKALAALGGEAAFTLLALPLLPRIGAVAVSLYACLAATAELAVLAALVDGPDSLRMPTFSEGVALAYLALVVTAGGFACWYAAARGLGGERVGLFAGLIPVSAALTAPLVGTGRLQGPQVAGSVIVGLGMVYGLSRGSTSHAPRANGEIATDPAREQAVPGAVAR